MILVALCIAPSSAGLRGWPYDIACPARSLEAHNLWGLSPGLFLRDFWEQVSRKQ
ncbi:hypothetical protein EV682_10585 [Iodobacter fluviatilis]|uniref:Uncharacterized protein n=1 Tax=Iodobacter fluviatilis TaxID=537 RepID=A0ABY2C953_9NEIS|nr:hypothetical protein EV682_10585 [Iodobacter fluviatilis]